MRIYQWSLSEEKQQAFHEKPLSLSVKSFPCVVQFRIKTARTKFVKQKIHVSGKSGQVAFPKKMFHIFEYAQQNQNK